nr:head-tail connector protein [uncultured Gellertiella sp.]
MTYILLSAPAAEPLTLADVKAHLRLDGTAEDDVLTSLIRVARDHLERATGLLPITQSHRLCLDSVCEDGVIQLVKGPVQRIDAIRVYGADGVAAGIDPARAAFDRNVLPARLMLATPAVSGQAINGIEVDFTAGFGASGNEVPDSIRRALLLHVAGMYEYRGAVPVADQPAVLPEGYDRLIAPFRIRRL